MVTAASKYIDRLNDVEAGLENEAYRIIAEIQEIIIDYAREEQLFKKGIDGKGERLEPYSPYTVALKKIKGEVFNRTTLLDTESFYQEMFITARAGHFFISSSDHKTPMLIEKYGEHIMVLTDDNNKIVNSEHIYPRLIQWMINKLFF